jgi:DNA polymerase (family 10)
MPIINADIALIFNKVADLLEIEGANPFRVRAYRDAARTFGGLSKSAADMIADGEDLTALPGIGKDLAAKVGQIVATGKLEKLQELEKRLPSGLHDLLRISGLGPKKVKALYDKLGIGDPAALQKAARGGKIRTLEGFGAKTEENILQKIENKTWGKPRTRWLEAEEIARAYVDYLEKEESVYQVTVAGSFRRKRETVGDLDILMACGRDADIMQRFVSYEDVDRVLSRGKTRSSVVLRSGLQVDLRKLPLVGYGAGLHYFTGSKAHNIAVRKLGQKKKLKINEYGVFKGDKRIAGRTEQSLFEQLGLAYIEPELRENRGEIEAARQGKRPKLPDLIRLEDIRGDLHVHTRETDGRNSLKEMAEAAKNRGYSYLAITEHSQSLTVARGLDAKRLAKSIEAVERLNRKMKKFKILKSIEVDIRKDGSLDLPNEILKELDLTVCAIHSEFSLSREKQTERILRAMDNPYFTILAHPTGRLINERDPYEVDVEKLIDAAAERGCFLELNAHPDRLDLRAAHLQAAREKGVKIAISTDAHSIDNLGNMRLGIGQARRGWLEADDVLNTRSWKNLGHLLVRKR